MAVKQEEKNPYSVSYEKDAPRVGTATFQKNMADELAREKERNRIQRQTVSASYAQQYEQARGGMMRQQMAGAAPGLTGGLAQQRTSEISGAQMRGLSQLSGQREQALREVDYQGLMAERQAFEFAQQQSMAQRDEQMFNLNMIQSRQSIIDGDMSDEDKREALLNTGLTPEQADAQLKQKNMGYFEKILAGKANPLVAGLGVAGVAGTAGFIGQQVGSAALSASFSNLSIGASSAISKSSFPAFKTALGQKALGKAIKKIGGKKFIGILAKPLLIANPVGLGIVAAALVIGTTVAIGIHLHNKKQQQ